MNFLKQHILKISRPEVNGKPSDEASTCTASSLLHATTVKETNSSHFKFFIIVF
jgi:hypothetical protein